MTIRAVSAPNIAFIKYWGNRSDELRLPAADSLSMTLDSPIVEVTVQPSERFVLHSFEPNGAEKSLSEKEQARLEKHFQLAKKYVESGGKEIPVALEVEIHSHVPKSVGLASSAAVFSALAEAYAGLAPDVSRRDVSVIARLGSGSASRSIFGGFSAMVSGTGEEFGSAYAEQIAPEDHWGLWDIIVAPSIGEKATGSTEGHALAPTSPLFEKRMREIGARQKRCIDAILKKDFLALQAVSEEDCLDMHEVMRTSNPPLEYLSLETHRIVDEVKKLRAEKDLSVLYTMDAGPTVHLICDDSALPHVQKYARTQKDCHVFESAVGRGSRLI